MRAVGSSDTQQIRESYKGQGTNQLEQLANRVLDTLNNDQANKTDKVGAGEVQAQKTNPVEVLMYMNQISLDHNQGGFPGGGGINLTV